MNTMTVPIVDGADGECSEIIHAQASNPGVNDDSPMALRKATDI